MGWDNLFGEIVILIAVVYILALRAVYRTANKEKQKAILIIAPLFFLAIVMAIIGFFNPPLPFNISGGLFIGIILILSVVICSLAILVSKRGEVGKKM